MNFIKLTKAPIRGIRYARLRHQHNMRAKRHRMPYTHCYNCGQELKGVYCHNCGQYARDISPSVSGFVRQYFENSFQWDGKFFRTIRTLFAHPGRLSMAWVHGHVARYVFPLKLYMFVMIVFGFCAIALTNKSSEDMYKKSYDKSVADFAIAQKVKHSGVLDSVSYNRVADLLAVKIEYVKPGSKVLVSSVFNLVSRLPIVFMFAMPFFAVLTLGFFRRRYKKFIPHLVFAIHIHTLFFIAASVTIIFGLFYNIAPVYNLITVVLSLVYTIVGGRVFFGCRWVGTIFKILSALVIYLICCFIILSIGFFANLYYDSLLTGTSFTSIFSS